MYSTPKSGYLEQSIVSLVKAARAADALIVLTAVNNQALSGRVIARVFLTADPSVYTPVHELIAH